MKSSHEDTPSARTQSSRGRLPVAAIPIFAVLAGIYRVFVASPFLLSWSAYRGETRRIKLPSTMRNRCVRCDAGKVFERIRFQ